MTYSILTLAPYLKWFEAGLPWQGLKTQSAAENLTHRIHLARHDHHNLELKTFVDPGKNGFQGWLELFLFVPSSFQLSRWEGKEIREDLHSRTRLAVSLCAEQGHKAMRDAVRQLTESVRESDAFDVDEDSLGADILVEHSKDAGAVIHETLRRWTSLHRRQCRLAHSLMHRDQDAANHLARLSHEVQRTADSIAKIREQIDSLRPERFPVLTLLQEYTTSLYVKYLSEVGNELSKCPTDRFEGQHYSGAVAKLSGILDQLSRRESLHVPIGGAHRDEAPTDEERESYLVRLSQLKKFFQSKMFVDVSRRPRDKRVAETTAFVGTALAGASAACLQQLYIPSSGEIAVSGFLILGSGVAVYTLRDRIKDWLKVTLAKKASAWIPDVEETLWVDGRSIGVNKEWSRILPSKNLPAAVKSLRRTACKSEVETELPEEVFSWKRWQQLPESIDSRNTELALQENVRINLERYLKFMDDPFKELAVLDRAGQFTRFRSRRVYHFYLAVRSTIQSGTDRASIQYWPERPAMQQIYRVVVNKKGIDRIEPIDDFTAPETPQWHQPASEKGC